VAVDDKLASKFGASVDFSKLNRFLNSQSSKILLREDYCLTEIVDRDDSQTEFTEDFINDVNDLPKVPKDLLEKDLLEKKYLKAYYKFLDKYGTHFFKKIIYGAKRVKISTTEISEKNKENSQNVGAGIDIGPMSSSVSVGHEEKSGNKNSQSVDNQFSVGFDNDNVPITEENITTKSPIKYEVAYIYKIFKEKYKTTKKSGEPLINQETIQSFQELVKEVLINRKYYCEHVKKKNPGIVSCDDFYYEPRVVGFKILWMDKASKYKDQCKQANVDGTKIKMSKATVLEYPKIDTRESFDVRYGSHVHSTKVYICQIKKEIKIKLDSTDSGLSEDMFISFVNPPRVVRTQTIARQLVDQYKYECETDKTLNGGAPWFDEMILCVKKTNELSDPGLADLAISVRGSETCYGDQDMGTSYKNDEEYAPIHYETRVGYKTPIKYYACHCFNINRKAWASNGYVCFAPSDWKKDKYGSDSSNNSRRKRKNRKLFK